MPTIKATSVQPLHVPEFDRPNEPENGNVGEPGRPAGRNLGVFADLSQSRPRASASAAGMPRANPKLLEDFRQRVTTATRPTARQVPRPNPGSVRAAHARVQGSWPYGAYAWPPSGMATPAAAAHYRSPVMALPDAALIFQMLARLRRDGAFAAMPRPYGGATHRPFASPPPRPAPAGFGRGPSAARHDARRPETAGFGFPPPRQPSPAPAMRTEAAPSTPANAPVQLQSFTPESVPQLKKQGVDLKELHSDLRGYLLHGTSEKAEAFNKKYGAVLQNRNDGLQIEDGSTRKQFAKLSQELSKHVSS